MRVSPGFTFFPSRFAAALAAVVVASAISLHAQTTTPSDGVPPAVPQQQPGTILSDSGAKDLTGTAVDTQGNSNGQSVNGKTTTTSPTTTTNIGQQTVTGSTTTTTDAQGHKSESATVSFSGKKKKGKTAKSDRVVQSKDTRRENARMNKLNPLAGKDASLPDKALYDKALDQVKRGHFDVARLDLETLLNTYPDSQYQMRAKLAIADSWYREGGTASLTQAEQEYTDFITFFPNVPEAAEAQMRVGDIYFKQMDVPDRDYAKATKAQAAYRQMLRQYPDSKLAPEARQKLRDVQEVMATREAEIGAFYATHSNWPATIARYQTVVDTYPQYSRMDDVLIGIGDAYASQARFIRSQPTCGGTTPAGAPCLPEAARSKLIQEDDTRAAAEYRKVVLEHAAAPHVEDAKERLQSMGLPVPKPTPQEMAASEELEGSRAQYNLQKRLAIMFMRRPDTVLTARSGEPPLDDPSPTLAPAIVRQQQHDLMAALNPAAEKHEAATPVDTAAPTATAATGEAATPVPASTAAPVLGDVPVAGSEAAPAGAVVTEAQPSGAPAAVGVEVLTPGVAGSSAPVDTAPAANPATRDAATGAPDPNYGLKAVGPANNAPLPAHEAAAPAPDQVNDVAGKPQPAAETPDPNSKKKPKPVYDKDDESSSKHKKKKGLDKLNPF